MFAVQVVTVIVVAVVVVRAPGRVRVRSLVVSFPGNADPNEVGPPFFPNFFPLPPCPLLFFPFYPSFILLGLLFSAKYYGEVGSATAPRASVSGGEEGEGDLFW